MKLLYQSLTIAPLPLKLYINSKVKIEI